MAISEIVTIPLSARQLAIVAGWQQQRDAVQTEYQNKLNLFVAVVVGGLYDDNDVAGCSYNVTDAGVVITPPSPVLKLEPSEAVG